MNLQDFAALYRKLNSVQGRVESLEVNEEGHLSEIVLNGFSKSGTLKVTRTQTGITTTARYNEVRQCDDVEYDSNVENAFDFILHQALVWYRSGIERGFGASPLWIEDWVAAGLLEKKTETVVSYHLR